MIKAINNTKKDYLNIDYVYLILGYKCNLRCKYCFMPKENRDLKIKTIYKLLNIIKNDRDSISLRFYGGEPFIYFNKIKEIINYVKKINLIADFAIPTNGTLLNEEIVKFIKSNNISIMVSLDGDKKTNDMMRIFANGEGTYDSVRRGILLLEKYDVPYHIAITIDRHNVSNLIHNIKHIVENYHPKSVNLNYPYSIKDKDLKQIINAIMEVNKWLFLNYRLVTGDFYENFIQPVLEGRKSLYCGGFEGHIVLHPNDHLSPCIALHNPPYAVPIEKVNSLADIYYADPFVNWRNLIKKYMSEQCYLCPYNKICSFGCPYRSILLGAGNKPDPLICELTKKFMKEFNSGGEKRIEK